MPPQLLMVPLMLLLFLGFFFYQRRAMAQSRIDNAAYVFRDFAARLGLQVVQGNPYQNLMFAQMDHSQAKVAKVDRTLFTSEHTKESHLRAEGVVWDRPYVFELYQRTDIEGEFNTTTTTSTFGAFLGAQIADHLPPFEVHVRNFESYAAPNVQTSLPPQSSGNAALDEIFVIKCEDPSVAPALVPVLVPLMTEQGLHLVGGDGRLRAMGTRHTYGYLLASAEKLQRSLEHLACIAEGKDASHVTASGAE